MKAAHSLQSFAIPLHAGTLVLTCRQLPPAADGTPRWMATDIRPNLPQRVFVAPTKDEAIRLLVEDYLEPPVPLVAAKGGA